MCRKKFIMPNDYMLTKTYNFFDKKEVSNSWKIGEGYGQVQVGNMNNYFQQNKNGETITLDKGRLILKSIYNPKIFNLEDFPKYIQKDMRDRNYPETFTIPFQSGKVVSKETFQYGIFKVRAKVPNYKYMWCAIWLTGAKTHPPEIDIAEFYNNGHIQFRSSNKIIAKTNIHYLEYDEKTSFNPLQKYVRCPDERYITYTLWWEKDFIRIYYDNILAFECTEKEILSQFNQPMCIILNNAIDWSVSLKEKDITNIRTSKTDFKIESVKYYSNNQ